MEDVLPEEAEDPGCVILELEIVLCGWSQFVSDNIERELVTGGKVFYR